MAELLLDRVNHWLPLSGSLDHQRSIDGAGIIEVVVVPGPANGSTQYTDLTSLCSGFHFTKLSIKECRSSINSGNTFINSCSSYIGGLVLVEVVIVVNILRVVLVLLVVVVVNVLNVLT